MGHKVNPTSFRLPVLKNWQAKWFASRHFADYLRQDIEISKILDQRFGKLAGVAKIEILREENTIKIIIHTSKPGILIGRSGQGINELRKYLYRHCPLLREPKTGLPAVKVEIEILEIKNPNLSAQLICQQIALQIEKRMPYKRAVKQAIDKVIEAKGRGVKICVAGRLGGAEIARRENYGAGSVPLGRLRAEIDFAKNDVFTTYGTIGIKVWIYKGDKVEVMESENANS
ncbi:MAG: 30S ribosomal protein S3 [Patescibacteria group bacterium]